MGKILETPELGGHFSQTILAEIDVLQLFHLGHGLRKSFKAQLFQLQLGEVGEFGDLFRDGFDLIIAYIE